MKQQIILTFFFNFWVGSWAKTIKNGFDAIVTYNKISAQMYLEDSLKGRKKQTGLKFLCKQKQVF